MSKFIATKHKEYTTWTNIIANTTQPSRSSFASLNKKGVKVCDRWKSFEAFVLDMGVRPQDTYLKRRNSHRDYSPDNCYWAPYNRDTLID